MSLEKVVTLWTLELETRHGVPLCRVLTWPDLLWAGVNAETMASRFVAAVEEQFLKEGEVLEALPLFPELECEAGKVVVSFPAKPLHYPALSLEVDTVQARLGERQHWVFAAMLGLSALGATPEAAALAMARRIQLDLVFRKVLESGRELLHLQAPTGLQLFRSEHTVGFYTFAEVREMARRKDEKILPRISSPMRQVAPAAFHREEQVSALDRAVTGRFARSALLVGPSGSGKTAILQEGLHRGFLKDVRETTPSRLIQTLTTQGGWQEGLARACRELKEEGCWLYVSNLAELFEVGRYVGNETSIGEYLRPWLQSGEIRLLTECTPEQVALIEARYPGYLDAFTRVMIPAPGAEVEAIVRARAEADGRRFGVEIRTEAVREILRIGQRFTPYSGFPGKAIRFLEALAMAEAAAGAVLAGGAGLPVIDRASVTARFCAETGIPPMLVDADTPLAHADILAWFQQRVYGQPEAVAAVVDTLAGVKADLVRRGRPIASLLLVGPTGVGKTETARALATWMFGAPDRMIRFDMSEFSSPFAVLRMAGFGEEEGLLTGAVRRQPFSVLLFDEVEKAHPSFLDLLLQVLGEGRLTDHKGRVADFCSTLVLMTSNVGAREAMRPASGFSRAPADEAGAALIGDSFRKAVMGWLRPEMFNRIDRVLPFQPLPTSAIERVLDREIATLRRRPGLEGVGLTLEPAAREWLIKRGVVPGMGARPLQRAIQDALVAPLSRTLTGWKRPGLPGVRAALHRDGLALTAEEVARPPIPDVAGYQRAQQIRRDMRELVESPLFARLEVAVNTVQRRRKNAPNKHLLPVTPEEQLRDDLVGARDQAADLEIQAGLAWLEADPQVMRADDLRLHRLDACYIDLARRLVAQIMSASNVIVLCVHGMKSKAVEEQGDFYTRVAERLGCAVATTDLYMEPRENEPHPVYHAVHEGMEVPKACTERIGRELEIRGPAAWYIFDEEQGLYEILARGAAAQRIKVVVARMDFQTWHEEEKRPEDIHRKGYYDGRPRYTLAEDLLHEHATNLKITAPSLPANLKNAASGLPAKREARILEGYRRRLRAILNGAQGEE